MAENRERNCRVSAGFSNRHGLYILIFSFYCSNDLSTGRSTCLRIACVRIILVSNHLIFWHTLRESDRCIESWYRLGSLNVRELNTSWNTSNIDEMSLNYFPTNGMRGNYVLIWTGPFKKRKYNIIPLHRSHWCVKCDKLQYERAILKIARLNIKTKIPGWFLSF